MTVFYYCKIPNCDQNNSLTTQRKFLFLHYLKHLRRDLNNTTKELGIIENPYHENKYSLINALVDNSKVEGV